MGDKNEFAILMRARRSTVDKIEGGGPGVDVWRDVLEGLDRQIAEMAYRAFWKMPEHSERGQSSGKVTALRLL